MPKYEYKVIPAPTKGLKARGVKTSEARFANAIEKKMNELAAEGWSYLRSDLLPSAERQGLTSSHTVYRSVLVFRRECLDIAEGDTTAKVEPAQDVEDEDNTNEDTETDVPDQATETELEEGQIEESENGETASDDEVSTDDAAEEQENTR